MGEAASEIQPTRMPANSDGSTDELESHARTGGEAGPGPAGLIPSRSPGATLPTTRPDARTRSRLRWRYPTAGINPLHGKEGAGPDWDPDGPVRRGGQMARDSELPGIPWSRSSARTTRGAKPMRTSRRAARNLKATPGATAAAARLGFPRGTRLGWGKPPGREPL